MTSAGKPGSQTPATPGFPKYSAVRLNGAGTERITVEKTPWSRPVVRHQNGVREDFYAYSAHEHQIALDRARVEPAFLEQLSLARADELITGAVALAEDPESERQTVQAHGNRQAIAKAIEGLVSRWRTAVGGSIEVVGTSRYSPIVEARALPAVWRRFLKSPTGAVRLAHVSSGPHPAPFAALDAAQVLGNDVAFNQFGNYAEGIRVGLLETGFDRAALARHEAFTYSTIEYQRQPTACTMDANCMAPQARACRDGVCVGWHGTAVASVLAHTKGTTPSNASSAAIYVANGGNACDSVLTYAKQLDWLIENDVHMAAETYRCSDDGASDGAHGYALDYYASVFDMTILTSAGNQRSGEADPACPTSANSICVGGIDDQWNMYCSSSYKNSTLDGYDSDREEPDIVSFSGQNTTCQSNPNTMEAASIDAPDLWTGVNGTSGSAPAVLSQLALAAKACGTPWFDHLGTRAAARTLAFLANPDGWKYSTPQPVPYTLLGVGDQRDGGGYGGFTGCMDETDPDHPHGNVIPAELPATPMPVGEYPNLPPGELNYTSQTGATGKPGYALVSRGGMLAGTRIRATVSWDACAIEAKVLNASGTVATNVNDFDVYLYDKSRGTYVFGSQSYDDNNEGFDVVLPEDGDYEIFLAWNGDLRTCRGEKDRVAFDVYFIKP